MTRPGVLTNQSSANSVDIEDWWWESRYTLKPTCPKFLKGIESRVLLAGKYLNVLHACGQRSLLKDSSNFPGKSGTEDFSIDHAKLLKHVDSAYHDANQALLEMLFKQQKLVDRLWYSFSTPHNTQLDKEVLSVGSIRLPYSILGPRTSRHDQSRCIQSFNLKNAIST